MSEETNEIIEKVSGVWGRAKEHMSSYLDVKSSIMDNEYVQLFGDASKIFGLVRNGTTLIMQKRFESFLKGFKPEEVPTEQQINKLIKYIDDESKAEFIADSFSKLLRSNSNKATLIMGSILYQMIENQERISHIHLVCVNGLTEFFDTDVTNFKFIYDYMEQQFTGIRVRSRSVMLEGRDYKDAVNMAGLEQTSLGLTIEKAVTMQLLNKYSDVEIDLDIDEDNPGMSSSDADVTDYYRMTEPGKLLYGQIKRCGF